MQKIVDILNNSKIKLIIVGVLLVIFIIIMGSSMLKKDKNEPETPVPEKSIVITNKLKKEVQNKLHKIKNYSYCNIKSNQNIYMNDCLYRKDLTLASDLSEEYRIYSLTLAIDELMEDKNNFIVGKIVVDNFQFTNTQYLEHDKLEQEYHELYGQNESVNIEAVNSLNKFPYVKYDATRKKIFYQTTGNKKETSTSEVIEYLNRLESDQNNVYAYISIAYTSTSTPNTLGVYTDKEKTNLYHNISISDYKKDEIIDENNYQLFKEYKFTFTKEEDTENLIFKQVELVK